MARFSGKVGFGVPTEIRPGVWKDSIVERSYRGIVIRQAIRQPVADKINNDITVDHSISIVSDPFALENCFAIRFVYWAGSPWVVTGFEIKRPRLILRLGGVYNGN